MLYRVLVKFANGSTRWVQLTAGNIVDARMIAEAQYTSNGASILQIITQQ